MNASRVSIVVAAGLAMMLAAHAVTVRPASSASPAIFRAASHVAAVTQAVSRIRTTALTRTGHVKRGAYQFEAAPVRLAAATNPPAGTGDPDPNAGAAAPPPPMTGSGAPYLIESAKIMAALQTADIQVSIHTTARPSTGKPQDTTGSLEIAWKPENKFRTSADGVAGKSLIVGTGGSLYVYNAKANEYLKKENYPVEAGQELVRNQLAVLLGPGAPVWIYQGVHDVDRHQCDEIITQDFNPSQTIYLDRTTHLPRRVIVSGTGDGGSGVQDTTFLKFQAEGPLPDSLFEFTPPRGAKAVIPDKP